MTILPRLGNVFLPHNSAARTLAIGAGIDSLGTGMFSASFALYFVGIAKFSATDVALATTLAGAAALLAPVPLGRLADRLGTGRFYIALLLARGLGYACFAVVSDFKGFLLLTVVLTAADRSSSPIQQAVVTAVIGGNERTRTMASIRAVRNVGLTAGFLLAAAAFAANQPAAFTAVFICNGLSFVAVAAMVRHALAKNGATVQTAPSVPPPAPGAAAMVRSPFRDRWFMIFTASDGVLSLYDTILVVLLPIWVITQTTIPTALVPVLMAINTVLTVLLQVYVAKFADGPARAIRSLVVSGALMALCCGFFAIAQTVSAAPAVLAIAAAVAVLSIAENLHAVATWELSAELSPDAARARYLGAFSLGFSSQKVIGPTLLVVVLLPAGLIAWPALAATFGTAALISRTAAKRCLTERHGCETHHQPTPTRQLKVTS